jgi:hypothetical protein
MNQEEIEKTEAEVVKDLHSKAEFLKNETEEFISTAKRLSSEGVKDAQKLLAFAKSNWKTVLGAAMAVGAGGAAFAKFKGGAKAKTSSKKTASAVKKAGSALLATSKKAAKPVKATAKKVAKKASKKTSKK